MNHISLSQSRFALVNDADYDVLMTMGRWYANASGYAILYIQDSDGKRQVLYLHRTVMARVLGHPVGRMQVDHINADLCWILRSSSLIFKLLDGSHGAVHPVSNG